MPDFERLTDSMRVALAPSAVSRAWARGYAAGKTRARLEVVGLVLAVYFGIALIGRFTT